jgi:hypothetical protein
MPLGALQLPLFKIRHGHGGSPCSVFALWRGSSIYNRPKAMGLTLNIRRLAIGDPIVRPCGVKKAAYYPSLWCLQSVRHDGGPPPAACFLRPCLVAERDRIN